MKSDTLLDYAGFQLSPKRTRCELFVSGGGETEILASGLLKPFLAHLRTAEEQFGRVGHLIKLEVRGNQDDAPRFTKGTLERFVRFVSTPEVLELVNTVDAEMSQLEAARNFQLALYSQGGGDQHYSLDGSAFGARTKSNEAEAADTSKRELLRAIDVRLMALQQELSMAFARASAAGFAIEHMANLLAFAERFGAYRLKDACAKFVSLCQKRQDVCPWGDDADTRSSGSDMSIENGTEGKLIRESPSDPPFKQGDKSYGNRPEGGSEQQQGGINPSHSRAESFDQHRESICSSSGGPANVTSATLKALGKSQALNKRGVEASSEYASTGADKYNQSQIDGDRPPLSSSSSPRSRSSPPATRNRTGSGEIRSNIYVDDPATAGKRSNKPSESGDSDGDEKEEPEPSQKAQPARRLSVKDRINLFESKQRDSSEGLRKIGKAENRRLSSESGNSVTAEKTVSRRWSGASDMSVELGPKSACATWNRDNSENSAQASTSGRDQSQAEAVTPQSEFRPPATYKQGVDENKDLGGLIFSSPKAKGQQQLGQGISAEAPLSDRQTNKPGSASLVSNPTEQVSNMGKQLTASMQSNLQPSRKEAPVSFSQEESFRSPEGYKRNEPSRAGFHANHGSDGLSNTKRPGEEETSIPKVKPSVGNKELNEELGGKANQLEAFLVSQKLRSQAAAEDVARPRSSSLAVKSGGLFAEDKMHAAYERSKQETGQFSSEKPEGILALPVQAIGRESLGSSWSNGVDFDMLALMSMADRSDMEQKLGLRDDGLSLELRGKYYERYMERRDAKLREEPVTKRAQKEAKLKAMQEALEHSRAEMAARSARFSEKRDPLVQARLRAEKLRSFNVRGSKNRKHQIEAEESDEETNDLNEQAFYRQDRIITFSAAGPTEMLSSYTSKEVPKTNSAKKFSSNKSMPSSTPRSSVSLTSPSLRSSAPVKVPSGSGTPSGRRRGLSGTAENSLAQSVPNFADLKKENNKPTVGRMGLSPALEKAAATSRGQTKSVSRSKSGSEDFSLEANGSVSVPRSISSKEVRRNQTIRKSCASVSELKDISAPTYEGVVLAPLKAIKEASEPIFYSRMSKKSNIAPVEARPFLRKGNGIGPGAGPGVAKMKASLAADNSKNAEDEGQLGDQNGEETVGEFENIQSSDTLEGIAEENESDKPACDVVETSDAQGDSDTSQNGIQGKANLNQASDRSDDGVSDNERISRAHSQANDASVTRFQVSSASTVRNQGHNGEMASSSGLIPNAGHAISLPHKHMNESPSLHMVAASAHFSPSVTTALDSPGESPASWNSQMHHSLSQMLEASDVDASADSPIGSPASWNSHSLSQMIEADADAARTRKKWGTAQKPVLVASQQSHKDVPKGFKRLLKFGRKNRGSETVTTDWVSASTTSEGDDDTEDTRDLAIRSADDFLRKSRMGFGPIHPSYDRTYEYGSLSGTVEGESFHEHGTIQSVRSSIPAPPANFRLREDHLAGGSSLKAPRSFFSLSTFRSKGSDTKSR